MKYNRINKKSYLKGRNIGEQFKTLILQTNKDYLSKDMMSDGVFPRLYERLFDAINKEISVTGMEYEDVVNTRTIADLIDSIKALEALSDGIVWKDDLIEKINTIFTDDSKDGVCLSTIHKSKGLEADNVYILCPSLMPSKHARQKWEIIAEDNLMYVAITRAKKTLNYISEKLFPANLFGDNDDIVSELEYQRKKMNKVLNTNSSALRNIDLTTEERVSIDAKRIMNTKNSKTRIVNEKKRNSIGGNKMSKFLK
jgi:superfamily I DNA/RNA helicase